MKRRRSKEERESKGIAWRGWSAKCVEGWHEKAAFPVKAAFSLLLSRER